MEVGEVEIWKDVPDGNGWYQASTFGRLRNTKTGNETKGYRLGKYFVYKIKGKTMRVHKIIAITFLGHVPDKFNTVIDHDDGNTLNNKLSNLKETTQRRNTSKDQHKHGRSSRYTGVSFDKNSRKWRAVIHKEIHKHIGTFNEEVDAHKAYQDCLKNLNNPNFDWTKYHKK